MGDRSLERLPRWWPLAVAGSVAFVVFLAVKPGSERTVEIVDNLVQLAVPLFLAFPLGLKAARRVQGRERLAWALLATACLLWGLGQAVWTWYEVVLDGPVPFPSAADIGFLAAVPFLLAGAWCYPTGYLLMGRFRVLIDAGIIGTSLLFAAYGTFLGELYEASDGRILDRVLALTYPVGDVATVAVVIAVLARSSTRTKGPLLPLGAGLVALAVADSSFAYITAVSEFTDTPTSAGWPIGFLLIGVAAAMALRAPTPRADAPAARAPRRLEAFLPHAPVLAGGIVFALRAVDGAGIGPFLGVNGLVVLTLLIGRQVFVQLENNELTSDLEGTVDQLRQREDELEFRAFHDNLTGLANRALFRNRLEHAVERRSAESIAVLFIDLDDFKSVNDRLGHDAGDRLLALVAERLRACVRAADTVSRLGGDEFGVLIDDGDGAALAPALAARILTGLEVPFTLGDHDLTVTASVGVVVGDADDSAEDLIQDADLAMYSAKGNGKAQAEVFDHSMRQEARERLSLRYDLEHALERQQFVVHYQPITRLATGEVAGYEALLRWEHPTRGLLLPAAFIDVAEETGAIVPIGWWVLRQALEDRYRFRRSADGTEPWVSVNVSVRQVRQGDAPRLVTRLLDITGTAPTDVILEITESALADTDDVIENLRGLHALGIRLAIDDFGTGYSSLAALASLPLDGVKIDQSFVARMGSSKEGEILVRAIIQLAASLGLRTIAEGVEHPWQLRQLAELGCDCGQGHLLGHPAALDDVSARV